MRISNNIIQTINVIQPMYNELNSRYSNSYLRGSSWYVGDDLLEWWNKSNDTYCVNIRFLISIIDILIINKNNEVNEITKYM